MLHYFANVYQVQLFLSSSESLQAGQKYQTVSVVCNSALRGPHIEDISSFAEKMNLKLSFCRKEGCNRLICTVNSQKELSKATFLIGAFLINEHMVDAQAVIQRILELNIDNKQEFVKFHDFLMCLHRARECGLTRIYSRVKPRSLVEVIPGAIFLIPEQAYDDARNQEDANQADELLPFLQSAGIRYVVRMTDTADSDIELLPSGYPDMQLCSIPLSGAATPLHSAVSFFFRRVVDSARPIAIVDRRGGGATLAALHLMRAHSFPAREAVAWLALHAPLGSSGSLALSVAQRIYLKEVEDQIRVLASGLGRAWPRARSAADATQIPERDAGVRSACDYHDPDSGAAGIGGPTHPEPSRQSYAASSRRVPALASASNGPEHGSARAHGRGRAGMLRWASAVSILDSVGGSGGGLSRYDKPLADYEGPPWPTQH